MRLQVTGDVQEGMTFKVKTDIDPLNLLDGKDKGEIGMIRNNDLGRLIETYRDLPPHQSNSMGLAGQIQISHYIGVRNGQLRPLSS